MNLFRLKKKWNEEQVEYNIIRLFQQKPIKHYAQKISKYTGAETSNVCDLHFWFEIVALNVSVYICVRLGCQILTNLSQKPWTLVLWLQCPAMCVIFVDSNAIQPAFTSRQRATPNYVVNLSVIAVHWTISRFCRNVSDARSGLHLWSFNVGGGRIAPLDWGQTNFFRRALCVCLN